jgi:hypothetical protein
MAAIAVPGRRAVVDVLDRLGWSCAVAKVRMSSTVQDMVTVFGMRGSS